MGAARPPHQLLLYHIYLLAAVLLPDAAGPPSLPAADRMPAICSIPQGGANAGHTIYDEQGNKYKLHLIPSGVLNPKATCVVGNGVVVHLPSLFDEIKGMKVRHMCLVCILFFAALVSICSDQRHKPEGGAACCELLRNIQQLASRRNDLDDNASSAAASMCAWKLSLCAMQTWAQNANLGTKCHPATMWCVSLEGRLLHLSSRLNPCYLSINTCCLANCCRSAA